MNVLQHYESRLTKKERQEYESARQRGYIVDKSRTKDALNMAYMCWCEIASTPYIGVRRGGISFSFLAGSAAFSRQGKEEVEELFQRYSLFDGQDSVLGNSGYAYALIPHYREQVARELFLKIRKPGVLDTSMKDLCPPLAFEQSPFEWLEDQKKPHTWG